MAEEYILSLEHITKTFPGVIALRDVTLQIKKGEVHALCGENGAGKSTLIKVCAGAYEADEGKIVIMGKTFKSLTPSSAIENGISVIYQEFNLIEELTVAENIHLGCPIRKGPLIDQSAMIQKSRKLFEKLNINIDPAEKIKNLTVGYRQIVEIAKAISKNARVLIMDEPSAPLTALEIAGMFDLIRTLKSDGVSIIYISHRLDEIFTISDRVTVLRDGQKIATKNTVDTSMDELIQLMVGRELGKQFPESKANPQPAVLLEAKHLTGNGVQDISFFVHQGEILGLAGLVGAGRTEVAELLFGVKPIEKGEIYWKGKPFVPKSPSHAIKNGIVLAPEDRKRFGNLLHLPVGENISISILSRISRLLVVNKKKEKNIIQDYVKKLRIKTPSTNQLVKNLSGGNQQKIVVAKWLATQPELIIFDEPTRGIDVGAKFEIYSIMNDLVANGKTIIMISSEMEELFGLANRILVLAEGHLTAEIQKQDFSQELVLKYASNLSE